VPAGALGIVSACATAPAASPPVPGPPPATEVTGMIVNAVTGRPLAGASIDVDGRASADSGDDGRFRLGEVPTGLHLMTIRRTGFRTRVQPAEIALPRADDDVGPSNDFIVLLFAPSAYFDSFPPRGATPPCRTEADCKAGELCLMASFKDADAPACTVPVTCGSERDCKIGQQCEPVTLRSGEKPRVCQGRPAPEVEE
jgi:hypothetical protein